MPINFLRLYRASITFFQAAKDEGTIEPGDTPALLAAHDGLMRALFKRHLSYAENLDALKATAEGNKKVEDALARAAEGAAEFLNRRTKRSWSIWRIGNGLFKMWQALDAIDKAALEDVPEHAYSIWHELLPVKEVLEPIVIDLSDAAPSLDDAETRRMLTRDFVKWSAKGKRDAWSLDEAFMIWAEGQALPPKKRASIRHAPTARKLSELQAAAKQLREERLSGGRQRTFSQVAKELNARGFQKRNGSPHDYFSAKAAYQHATHKD